MINNDLANRHKETKECRQKIRAKKFKRAEMIIFVASVVSPVALLRKGDFHALYDGGSRIGFLKTMACGLASCFCK